MDWMHASKLSPWRISSAITNHRKNFLDRTQKNAECEQSDAHLEVRQKGYLNDDAIPG